MNLLYTTLIAFEPIVSTSGTKIANINRNWPLPWIVGHDRREEAVGRLQLQPPAGLDAERVSRGSPPSNACASGGKVGADAIEEVAEELRPSRRSPRPAGPRGGSAGGMNAHNGPPSFNVAIRFDAVDAARRRPTVPSKLFRRLVPDSIGKQHDGTAMRSPIHSCPSHTIPEPTRTGSQEPNFDHKLSARE